MHANTQAPASVAVPAEVPSEQPPSEDYSYSDDDWGPPRDEDAPPLDEEPPMDWVPPSDSGWQSAPAAPLAAVTPPAPADVVPSPASAPAVAAPEREAATQETAPATDTSHDPWSRAVEQSPGAWVVGTSSNVGTHVPAEPAPADSAPAQAESGQTGSTSGAPAYEPAAAQAPAQQAPAQQTTKQAAQQVPAPAAAPASSWATVPAPTVEAAGNAPGKQSLYQRLSNSPEALAGRIQVPARSASATATMVEDIPSADDETIEESGVFGRAAVERILGGRLLEERSLDGTPLMRR